MKKIFFLCCCFGLLMGGNVFAQESTTKIKIKVKDADGTLIEKEYDSEEAMRNDPELEELGITVKEGSPGSVYIHSDSKGEGQQIMVFKRKGGGDDDFSYEYKTGNPNHFFSDTSAHRFRQRFHSDSMGFDKSFSYIREHRQELDSLLKERRVFVMAMSDSMREIHFEDMEKHREKMKLHREEMREHMREMRERMKEMKVDFSDDGNRVIIIQSLSKEEAEKLEEKDQSLQLNEFKLYPNPSEGNIKIELEAIESSPVQVKLLDSTGNRVLYDETHDISGGFFKDTIEIDQYEPGTYILQIIQNNKALSRRVIMR